MNQESKLKILLIEDDKLTIDLYEEVFRKNGFDIEAIEWGESAIERLKEIREEKKPKPDLILLDLILPDMNGLLILKEAKRYSQTKNLKIFVLTNYSNPDLNEELIREGINEILLKTEFTPKKLVGFIKETLGLK